MKLEAVKFDVLVEGSEMQYALVCLTVLWGKQAQQTKSREDVKTYTEEQKK